MEFKLTNLSALKYATLSKAEILLNGITKSATLSGSSVPSKIIDFGIVNSSSDLTATIVLTDSRGNKATYTKDITIVDWVQPSAIINCQRKNNYYSTTDLTVDGSISSINDKNVIKIQYQYKKTTDTNYSALKTIQDNTPTSFDIDNNYAWDIRVIISDLLGSTTYNVYVDKGIPIVYFDRLLSSMGVNCFPNEEKSLSLNGETVLTLDRAFPVGAVYITFNNNNPGNFLGGTWIQFGQGRTLIGVGSYTDSKGITGEYAEGTSAGTYNPIYAVGVTGNIFRGIGAADEYAGRILAVKDDIKNEDPYIKGFDIYGYDKTVPYVTVYFWRRTA